MLGLREFTIVLIIISVSAMILFRIVAANGQGNYTDSLRNFFVAVTIIVIGGLMLFKIRAVDIHTMFAIGTILIPAIVVMGFLGQKIGEIVDSPKNKTDADYKAAVLNALKKMDKSVSLEELNEKLSSTVAEPDAPDEDVNEDIDV